MWRRHACPTTGARPRTLSGAEPAVRFLQQVLIVLGAVVAYFGVRGLTEGDLDTAVRNAERLVAVERLLGLDLEGRLQAVVLSVPFVTTVANWVYIYGHWPLIAVVLCWLAIRHRPVFLRVRNAMLVSGGIGIVIFAMLPVAPPRLAGLGLMDTVTERSNSYRVLQPAAFTNQYAALPSLHVGWNLVVSLAVILATRRVFLRVLAVAVTLSMDAAVVLTANHYLLDVVAGLALAGGAWVLVGRGSHHVEDDPRSDHQTVVHRAVPGDGTQRGPALLRQVRRRPQGDPDDGDPGRAVSGHLEGGADLQTVAAVTVPAQVTPRVEGHARGE